MGNPKGAGLVPTNDERNDKPYGKTSGKGQRQIVARPVRVALEQQAGECLL